MILSQENKSKETTTTTPTLTAKTNDDHSNSPNEEMYKIQNISNKKHLKQPSFQHIFNKIKSKRFSNKIDIETPQYIKASSIDTASTRSSMTTGTASIDIFKPLKNDNHEHEHSKSIDIIYDDDNKMKTMMIAMIAQIVIFQDHHQN